MNYSINQTNNRTAGNNPFAKELTPDKCAVILIDRQTGLLQFLPSI